MSERQRDCERGKEGEIEREGKTEGGRIKSRGKKRVIRC